MTNYNCPVCGHPLIHIRFWNEEVFGIDDNDFIGWICENRECKSWYCDNCQEYHSYGTSCLGNRSDNWRYLRDPNWRHKESDLFENKYKSLLKFMRNRK